jgi:uncharacterized SAM-binding protein YcdF (DUF218 family)
MTVPDGPTEPDARTTRLWPQQKRKKRGRWFLWTLLLALVAATSWIVHVCNEIHYYSTHNQARAADAIAVFGAAEYDGRPSPVLRARLMQGYKLYQEKLAPLMITLGGNESGEPHSEGGVGEDFLMAHGVPERAIIAETKSRDTRESAQRLAIIARSNNLHSIIAVSDGTHLFRIHMLCKAAGLTVYTSPRPEEVPLPRWLRFKRVSHEVASYTLWRLGILR